MKTGTKSVLFGAHQFILHPLTVFLAWWKLYGFPYDPRLWLAFFIHDLGYIGKENMDDEIGERHPEFAAKFMSKYFGKEWGDFCLFHSRFYSKRYQHPLSKLCFADKYSFKYIPNFLYIFLIRLS